MQKQNSSGGNKRDRSNPLLQNTETETKEEDVPTQGKQPTRPTLSKPPEAENKPLQQIKPPNKLNLDNLPPSRSAKRRTSKEKKFADRHVTVSLSIDNRIASSVNDFLDRGARLSGNKTVFASQLFLKLLIDAGYQIDHNILSDEE